jgi:hypothetical protein
MEGRRANGAAPPPGTHHRSGQPDAMLRPMPARCVVTHNHTLIQGCTPCASTCLHRAAASGAAGGISVSQKCVH